MQDIQTSFPPEENRDEINEAIRDIQNGIDGISHDVTAHTARTIHVAGKRAKCIVCNEDMKIIKIMNLFYHVCSNSLCHDAMQTHIIPDHIIKNE
jgi:hypothetical protein